MAGADWRSIVRDGVAARAVESSGRGASDRAHISRVGFSVAAHHFLIQAVRLRGISVSGYIRRATLAMVAADLGLEATDLFAIDVGILPVGRKGGSSKDLDGELYGRWEVERVDPTGS